MTTRIACNATALRRERAELLASIGMDWEDLAIAHAFHDLTSEQFEVWLAVRRISFLLGE